MVACVRLFVVARWLAIFRVVKLSRSWVRYWEMRSW